MYHLLQGSELFLLDESRGQELEVSMGEVGEDIELEQKGETFSIEDEFENMFDCVEGGY